MIADNILQCLKRNEGKLVRDADLASAAGCKPGSVPNHVSHLRQQGHVIDRHRQCGFVYAGRRTRTVASCRDNSHIGENWRPEHVGDPLLDRLREVHGRDVVDRNVVA